MLSMVLFFAVFDNLYLTDKLIDGNHKKSLVFAIMDSYGPILWTITCNFIFLIIYSLEFSLIFFLQAIYKVAEFSIN